MNYWEAKKENSKIAQRRTAKFEKNPPKEMLHSLERTEVWGINAQVPPQVSPELNNEASFQVVQMSTTEAIYEFSGDSSCIALNFADYKRPGGCFMEGSCAQEESLCHESWLYNILLKQTGYYEWNKQHLNRGLYLSRALHTPDVHFEHNGKHGISDVLTCAAPNRSIIVKGYGNFTEEENSAFIEKRMHFIRDIVATKDKDTFILGAWGCGVFKQNPKYVAELIRDTQWLGVKNVIAAIIDKPTYNVFKEILT